jgi:hypothetical protein
MKELGVAVGFTAGILCFLAGMQGKAQSISLNHPMATGPVHDVPAALVPFPGMEQYHLQAWCADEEDCKRLERRLDELGYERH